MVPSQRAIVMPRARERSTRAALTPSTGAGSKATVTPRCQRPTTRGPMPGHRTVRRGASNPRRRGARLFPAAVRLAGGDSGAPGSRSIPLPSIWNSMEVIVASCSAWYPAPVVPLPKRVYIRVTKQHYPRCRQA